ncbi:MAG: hypothetical protein OJF49_003990 [Ktedonobacterales bacterium]|nr:MAG: hypothetical protein OJF49_003990 [Ktedonobacterales bacterium]
MRVDRHTRQPDTQTFSAAVPTWLRLVRAFHKIEHALTAQLRCDELSMAQFDVLAQVGHAEGMMQQELADRLQVTKGNVCQLLDRMARDGIVERRQDGRANRLYLTETGHRLYEQMVPTHEAEIARLLAALTPDEQRQLGRLLRKLDRSLS